MTNETDSSRQQDNIYTAMAAIMREIEAVPKQKSMSGPGGYRYRGIDDLYKSLHEIMARHGVFVLPQVVEHREEYLPQFGKNGGWRTEVHMSYRFQHESGSHVECESLGGAMGFDDKGYGKALSYAQKNALLHVFLIPVENMDDESSQTLEQWASRGAGARKETRSPSRARAASQDKAQGQAASAGKPEEQGSFQSRRAEARPEAGAEPPVDAYEAEAAAAGAATAETSAGSLPAAMDAKRLELCRQLKEVCDKYFFGDLENMYRDIENFLNRKVRRPDKSKGIPSDLSNLEMESYLEARGNWEQEQLVNRSPGIPTGYLMDQAPGTGAGRAPASANGKTYNTGSKG